MNSVITLKIGETIIKICKLILFIAGKGLYGDVFLAQARNIRESESESLVVVKSLLNKDEQLFFEFKHEMDMFSRLEHPNITKLLGVCREAEPNFMITEYCDWVCRYLCLFFAWFQFLGYIKLSYILTSMFCT